MTDSFKNQALLILAHGSSQTSSASRSTKAAVLAIQRRASFGSVHCAFWKEEPGFRSVWDGIREREVFVVPNFISEGYFTREVIPRELGLDEPTTERGPHLVHYCKPVGLHPGMTELLINNARQAMKSPPEETSLLLLGHGTERNSTSTLAIEAQVKKIWESDIPFAQVTAAYLDESPFLSDWESIASAPNVVVVPFFISEGMHTLEDIPRILSRRCAGFRTIQQAPPVGIASAVADMIVDQVVSFNDSSP